tara:strand:+ start:1051 stop:1455 length:405 start_codon:yes stop_codon:yes gene_type:complete
MASELRVNTLKDASGNNSIATSFVANGSAKAFNVFEPDVAATIASLNISTLTDNGTGDFSHAFTSSFGAAKQYTVAGSCGNSAASTNAIEYCKPSEEAVILASSLRTSTGYVTPTAAALYDYPNSSFACQGDLA